MKFYENPAPAVAVIRADGQTGTKKSAVAFRDCFEKAPKIESE